MARLKGPLGWLVAALVICGAVSVAYLPPRGASRESRATQSGLMTGPPTVERLRANELAKAWRRATLDLRLHEWRERLTPQLDRRRAANQPTFVTVIDSTWPPAARERAAQEIELLWQALGLGTTKIGVAVVIEPERVGPAVPSRTQSAFLLPDSVQRHTCVAWATPTGVNRALFERTDEQYVRARSGWLRRALGPCAFYAAFGRPSPTVERWLGARQHRYATAAAWDVAAQYELPWFDRPGMASDRAQWRRWAFQQYPALALGCMAGRAQTCRDALVVDAPAYGTPPSLVANMGEHQVTLPASMVLLTDMVRDFGHARFARFWISDLPPDSAFHIAMDTTLGDWMVSQQREYGTTVTAGPTPTLAGGAFGLSLAALGVLLAMAAARRRQVG